MVFVYLPLYFGIGVILFFVWRLAVLSWKRYGRPRRPRAAREVDGGAPDAAARTGNAARVLVVSLVVAVVVGLVGFAIGRATFRRGPFVADFPEGWGPLGFEIPAIVVGALAASFFAGGLTRPRRAPEAGSKDAAEDEWLRLDRSRALLVAAAALFVALAALQYDYKLLGEVTKLSAGPDLSVEFAQTTQGSKAGKNSGSMVSGSLVAAAQPRTDGINYATDGLTQMGTFSQEDDLTGQVFSGVNSPTYKDQLSDNLNVLLQGCVLHMGMRLLAVQQYHNSEFPSVSGVEIAVDSILRAEGANVATDARKTDTSNKRIVIMSSLLMLMRRVYDGVIDLKNREYIDQAAIQLVTALRDHESVLISDLVTIKVQTDMNKYCNNVDAQTFFGQNTQIEMPKSNGLGYLAILTAFSEFADGNRESAIRLLHDRIASEWTNLNSLKELTNDDKDGQDKLYLVARKQAMINRLIRTESVLFELVQDPVRSPTLDQIAFDLMVKGIRLDPFLISNTDQVKSDEIVMAALKSGNDGRCSDQFPPPDEKNTDKNRENARRIAFYSTVYNHISFLNNALNYVGKNGEVVLSASWNGAKKDRPLERELTQSNLIKDLDAFADRLIKILNNPDLVENGALSCLGREDKHLSLRSSDLLETVGGYFETKGKNFGAGSVPRTSDYDDSSAGPIQRAEDRIKSLCYAIIMYEDASDRTKQSTQESPEQNSFAKSLDYYNQFEDDLRLSSKPSTLEAAKNAYSCNGIFISDFYTPNYFDPVKAGGVRYSFTGAITEPLQVLLGGYLSWQDPESNSWWQETWFAGSAPKLVRLGPIDQRTNGNVRAVIDRATMSKTIRMLSAGRKQAMAAGLSPGQNQVATIAHARNLRARIDQILGRSSENRPVRESPVAPPAEPDSPEAVGEGGPGAAQPYDQVAAVQYGLLIEAVYSMYYTQPTNPTPPPQPDFPKGFRLVAWVQMNDFTFVETSPQFYGVIAQSVTDSTKFVLALRGTEGWIEWFNNFTSVFKVPFRVPGCGSVSYGFNRIYDTMEIIDATPPAAGAAARVAGSLRAAGSFSQQTAALVRRHAPAQPQGVEAAPRFTSIDVTAHSLGGALATLYVLENAKEDKIPNQVLYTFASPMVGDTAFAAAFDALGLTSWRIVNEPDLVPKAPGEFFGYQHIGVEKAYDSTGIAQANPPCCHAMATYLALIDRTRQPDPGCQIQAVAAAAPVAARVAAAPLAAPPPTVPAVDASTNVTTYLPALAAAGVKAVGRYYSIDTSKVLTQMEAKAITNVGMSIFVVYEDGADPVSFNASLGTYHAQNALTCAREVGQPQGSAIYFAIDFDCTATQLQQQITPYFQAIGAVFAAQGFPYKIGVYGNGLVCQGLVAAGLCPYTWLTNSTAFEGYNQFYASKRWNLAQHLPKYYGKLQADPNETAADFGAFKVGTSALAAAAALQPALGAFEGEEAPAGEGAAPPPGPSDGGAISNLLAIASNPKMLQAAQAVAAQRLLVYDGEKYPQDGCAITLSVLLQEAGVDVPDTYMAIDICGVLQSRGWTKIAVGDQQKGDVGSTCGAVAHHGTDHVYVVLRDLNLDEMVVADNQESAPHFRFASGVSQSPTTYFLRAPNVTA